jgi:hypothetical protein
MTENGSEFCLKLARAIAPFIAYATKVDITSSNPGETILYDYGTGAKLTAAHFQNLEKILETQDTGLPN